MYIDTFSLKVYLSHTLVWVLSSGKHAQTPKQGKTAALVCPWTGQTACLWKINMSFKPTFLLLHVLSLTLLFLNHKNRIRSLVLSFRCSMKTCKRNVHHFLVKKKMFSFQCRFNKTTIAHSCLLFLDFTYKIWGKMERKLVLRWMYKLIFYLTFLISDSCYLWSSTTFVLSLRSH